MLMSASGCHQPRNFQAKLFFFSSKTFNKGVQISYLCEHGLTFRNFQGQFFSSLQSQV